ncbi:PAAR domain-containing protein [Cupriavidus sp. SZY C1]|uniref:PAAR domain-containing protein n=1 Tax=Cupriavidus sp. SZY C1 TaxID=3055037 RepID=UPI0028B9C3D4|nr:PAAR domain-containing protein [Cupriavidus sp. SZY C1]MDT6962421.1 PAAR domain-containing protein [Cupriavidus sp. SZY C1]
MPEFRYALLDGDKTTTGGVLAAACPLPFRHQGTLAAVEGNIATCPKCQSAGPVWNDCDAGFEVAGKRILVSGAKVYCKCPTPPLVIHSQTTFRVEVRSGGEPQLPSRQTAYAESGQAPQGLRPAGFVRARAAQAEEDIEVFIFDSRYWPPESSFGHAAIGIDQVVYSRAHRRYYKGSLADYLRSNTRDRWWDNILQRWRGMHRDVVGLVLRVSPAEKKTIRDELDRRVLEDAPYSLTRNSCSTNVADVLEMIGVLASDPRYLATPVSPAELMRVLEKSDRLIERRFYPKGYQGGASDNW